MFTGIVTGIGEIVAREERGDVRLTIAADAALTDLALGASIACSGACLTVVDFSDQDGVTHFAVDVSAETIACTAQNMWNAGAKLNLERALRVGDELGGHIVTGHVDGVGTLTQIAAEGDSTRLTIAAPAALAGHIAAKGSITINGVSLTVNTVEDSAEGTHFGLNIIPHTAAMTTLGTLKEGDEVNLEIDILARYLDRMLAIRANSTLEYLCGCDSSELTITPQCDIEALEEEPL